MTLAGRSPSLQDRIRAVLASPRVLRILPPRADAPWAAPYAAPADLQALYEACDGLVTENGFTLLGRGEIHDATRWLVLDRALGWPEDLLVIGERTASAVVLDLDVNGVRAGGGVLEAASDDLESFERVASDAVAYVELQVGLADPAPPPEVLAGRAAEAGDREKLEAELARPAYPGQERRRAALLHELGRMHAFHKDEARALAAFERSADARAGLVRKGAAERERAAAWKAAAITALGAGAEAVAAMCEARAKGGAAR